MVNVTKVIGLSPLNKMEALDSSVVLEANCYAIGL
jgi:hypothetical protein